MTDCEWYFDEELPSAAHTVIVSCSHLPIIGVSMRPRVFLSSTIQDLKHIREALRSTIDELGYEPVMSEHGEVGYLPDKTAEESCYSSLEQCDLLIGVIGRRYGSIGKGSKSVTQNEVRRARELNIPVYCFIDRDAAAELRVLENNPDATLPSFDNPVALSEFVAEVMKADKSNSVITFLSVEDAQVRLKRQIAILFGNLLRSRFNGIQSSIAELLVEVRELRYSLPPDRISTSAALMAAVRFFLNEIDAHGNDPKWHYRRLIVSAKGEFSAAVPSLSACQSFREFLERSGVTISVMDLTERQRRARPSGVRTGLVMASSNGPMFGIGSDPSLHYVLFPNLEFWVDERVLKKLEELHFDFKRIYTELVRDAQRAMLP